MKKIKRGNSKNGPVYAATKKELALINQIPNKVVHLPNNIIRPKPANQSRYKPDELDLTGKKLPNRKHFKNDNGDWYSLPRNSVCFIHEKPK